ncbi:tRNA lysidine(34) synthetase TilS [Desulfuromonas carbonis]|uniref:tRNA lysidine(34) synthetase TilS n=1 Tax=Desulfuromonas sp. DDH964 TaxID=1823759 RepID=UPI00078DAA3D|nr:tRNA lysidine(34) synthetase TilS [Desulfuromonas sp. DDH964]AMV71593.1 tRNA(Ile) lysidine-34 synthase [Desulfuromonas sp. DDH964]
MVFPAFFIGAAMLAKVSRYIRRHALVTPGDRVLVAVSGGSDSLALLDLLHQLATQWSLELVVAHLDHGMRAGSAEDAEFVADFTRRLGLPLVTARVDVPALAQKERGGLEAAARSARRRFLREVAAERGCRVIALGQQRDDQAETVLERLMRGSTATGLAAMRPRSGPFIRPLLECSRQQLQDYLRARGSSWAEDPSNLDPAFTRNRIRHQLLPHLAGFNPRITERLAAFADRCGIEEDYWEGLLADQEARLATSLDGTGLQVSIAQLAALHPALRDRLLHRLLGRVRGGRTGLLAVHIAAVAGLLEDGLPQRQVHLPGVVVLRRYDRLQLRCQPPAAAGDLQLQISAAGEYLLPGGMTLGVELRPAPLGGGPWAVEFAAAATPWPLTVRHFQPGDRIRLAGGGHHRVKELLRAARLPGEVRAMLPLVAADELLWVPGLRRCPGRVPEHGEKVLRLTLFGATWATNNL